MGPLELYEKLTEQGDQVRALKTAKANKVGGNGIKSISNYLVYVVIVDNSQKSLNCN